MRRTSEVHGMSNVCRVTFHFGQWQCTISSVFISAPECVYSSMPYSNLRIAG
jgi:hypothetical protein